MEAPTSYEEYILKLRQQLNFIEGLADKASGLDERLDVLVRLTLAQNKILSAGLLSVPELVEIPAYSVRSFKLDDTTPTSVPREVEVPGNYLTFYSTGNYSGIQFALESSSNDWIPITYFGNPYTYPGKFSRFFLSWDSQPGKELWVHIGRKSGASPGQGPPATSNIDIQTAKAIFDYGRTTLGTTATQLTSSSFSAKIGVMIKSSNVNVGDIHIGDSSVTTSNGFLLRNGEAITLEIEDITSLYGIASQANQYVYYIGV